MNNVLRIAIVVALGAVALPGTWLLPAAAPLAAEARQAADVYAIQGARIVPVSGPVIDTGTIVFRDGVITEVGANVAAPAGAQVIDGKGLTVYPGLIDMESTAGLSMPPVPRAEGARTTKDVERVKASYLLRAHLRAADHLDPEAAALLRAAAAGITTALATPTGDAFRGQSALVRTSLPEDQPQIGAPADARKGALVLRTPVALHVTFSQRPAGGNAYPNSLMGVIAFVRQAFLDAQHVDALEKFAAAQPAGATGGPSSAATVMRPPYDPAIEVLRQTFTGQLPVAFEGETARQILRAVAMAREFNLTPIITNGREADQVAADLKAANARVILSLNYPARPESLGPDADEPLSALRARANAPETAAALAKAGVPFAFGSNGLSDPRDFIRNAAKAVEAGLSREEALRALTLHAATMAGASNSLGSLEAGKMANILVTEGDLFDEKMQIRHVFVGGHPVNLEAAAALRENRRGQP